MNSRLISFSTCSVCACREDARVQPRILNGLPNARSGELQQMQVFGLKIIRLLRLDIDDADHAILDDQRHCQLRADMRIDVDIVFRLADVVHQHGLARLCRLSDNPFAHADTHALSLRRMADLEAHPQIVGAVVEQQNGEDAVIDDRAHKVGCALQQCLEVKRRVQRIGEPDEVFGLQWFDARGRFGERRLGGGPIVPFKTV